MYFTSYSWGDKNNGMGARHGLKARHLLSYRLAYAWLTSSKINQNGERERKNGGKIEQIATTAESISSDESAELLRFGSFYLGPFLMVNL